MRRFDVVLATIIFEALILGMLLFLAWCQWRGFDPSLCRAYGECGWMYA